MRQRKFVRPLTRELVSQIEFKKIYRAKHAKLAKVRLCQFSYQILP